MTITISRIALFAILLFCIPAPAFATDVIPTSVTEQMLFADDPREWLTIRRVSQPEYPKESFAAGVTGYVDLTVTIDEVGTVKKIGAVVSQPTNLLFENSARENVKYWQFRPAISRNCVPEIAEGNVRVWFEIRDGKEVVSVSSTSGTMGEAAQMPSVAARPSKWRIINRDDVMREIRFPREARQVGAQADVYGVMEVDSISGLVRNVEIAHVISSSKQLRWRFSTAVADGLKSARFDPIESMAGKPFKVCMPFSFRLTK